MTIDHIGWLIDGTPVFFRVIGRLAAPIFCYLIAQGFMHTRSKQKYFMRLYIASILMAIVNDIFNGCLMFIHIYENIFLTFAIGVLFLFFFEEVRKNKKRGFKYIGIYILIQLVVTIIQLYTKVFSFFENTFTAITLNVISIPYGIAFPILIVLFYYSRHKKLSVIFSYILFCSSFTLIYLTNIISYITVNCGLYGGEIAQEAFSTFAQLLGLNPRPTGLRWFSITSFQWVMFFSLPFILLYNGERGKGYKYFFYIYYPAHIYFLVLVKYLISKGYFWNLV